MRRATTFGPSRLASRFNFYPRSTCGERQTLAPKLNQKNLFLSTLSLRRATRRKQPSSSLNIHFYPRSPCGERHEPVPDAGLLFPVFLSTLSLRRATRARPQSHFPPRISIHALLAESDAVHCDTLSALAPFLSTLSLRRATEPTALRTPHQRFLSTLSLRRATRDKPTQTKQTVISIHALLAESDVRGQRPSWGGCLFLSTLSLRRATMLKEVFSYVSHISIHALLAESDSTPTTVVTLI